MLPAFLITFREVIEASLIVATVLGILIKLKQTKSIKTVWIATVAAAGLSAALIVLGSLTGVKVQEIYSGPLEGFIEGILMTVSAVFITWAVFFLHNYFSNYKLKLLQKLKDTVEKEEQKGLFVLVFTAVFREGFEIALFLSTIYFSSKPKEIFTGFAGGIIAGLLVSFALFSATLKMPVYYAFRVSSALLILFAAGLVARGAHEFAEAGLLPEIREMIFPLIPTDATYVGDMFKSIFGITQRMDILQIVLYVAYTAFMVWWVFFRNRSKTKIEKS
ncbi:FTR1 family protein [soil metagenome]